MSGTIALVSDVLPHDVTAHGYRAHEGVSLPFAVDVRFSTADASFQVDACLQHRMSIEVDDMQGSVRYYDGLPDRVRFLSHEGDRFHFEARLRPALAALEHREGSRIFQDKSPVDVVKQILKDAGVDEHVEWRLQQTYAAREFLCQYRETEMNFVHRLLEDEGIFYFFDHSVEGHKLVFADDPTVFKTRDGQTEVVLVPRQGGGPGAQPLVGLSRRRSLRPTQVVLRDYDFEKPDTPPEAALPAKGPYAITHYEYPGGFTKSAEGSRRSRGRLSSMRGDVDLLHGKSRAAGLTCGAPARIEGVNEAYLNGEIVVMELRSEGSHPGECCSNEFTAIPKDAAFAAPRRAKKPKIRGIQTAVVTGPSNEPQAIHVDKYGRIKVRFLWDRSGKQDDTASCWLRVAQLGLGASMVLPRVGWEVAVAFLEGDPDRPIVLGRTYNAEHTPPYALPGASADSSMKTMSTPGGAGHNEVKMSDTSGKQGHGVAAQKDLNSAIGNDKNETVGVNDDTSVGTNYNVTIGSNETSTIGGNQSVDVGNALQCKVGGAQSVVVGGNDQTHAKCDMVEKVGGARDYSIGGNQITISCGVRQDVTSTFKRDVGAVHVNMSLASIDDNMLATYDEKTGAVMLQLVAGASAESVGTSKKATSLAAELHVVSAMTTSANGVKQLIGGVHLHKVAGDFVVKAPKIILGGGVGKFNGGGSSINLNGGPVTLKGSSIAIEAAAIVKLASSLKIG